MPILEPCIDSNKMKHTNGQRRLSLNKAQSYAEEMLAFPHDALEIRPLVDSVTRTPSKSCAI